MKYIVSLCYVEIIKCLESINCDVLILMLVFINKVVLSVLYV